MKRIRSLSAAVLAMLLASPTFAKAPRSWMGATYFPDGTVESSSYLDTNYLQLEAGHRMAWTFVFYSRAAQPIGDLNLAGGRMATLLDFKCNAGLYRQAGARGFDEAGQQVFADAAPTEWLSVSENPKLADVFGAVCGTSKFSLLPAEATMEKHAAGLFEKKGSGSPSATTK